MMNGNRDMVSFGMFLRLGLLVAALVEGVWGVMQFAGMARSGHNLFPFTGSFYNPGPFACYLALTFPLALHEAFKGRSKLMRLVGGAVILLDALLLPASMSRTAWIAALTGCVITFYPAVKQCLVNRRSGVLWFLIGGVVVVAGLAGAYRMKMASADGRLLMWKVSLTAVKPEPFNGVGWDMVAGEYGNAQERYFASGLGSESEIMSADAPEYVFNEYLQVAIAYGWGWAGLMVLFMLASLTVALRNGSRGIAGCAASAMLVMMASYPFQFHLSVITIAVILLTGFLSTTLVDVRAVGLAGCLLFAWGLWNESPRGRVRSDFATGHRLHLSGRWEESNAVLLPMSVMSADPMPLNIIGKNYSEMGRTDSAEYYLRRSVNRCPNRLYPHYLLMKLYSDSAAIDAAKAIGEARYLLNTREKISSPAVEEMRDEARILLKTLQICG